jgi:DNA repair exonuclease SbcCD nuclease subunit
VRIGIASDFHLGFGSGKRKNDAVVQAKRAMRELLRQDVDAIVLAGDIFNSPVPRPEALRDAVQVLHMAFGKAGPQVTGVGRDSPEMRGLPVIAVHGNHDRRVRGDVNPTRLMDLMGYLVYLHNDGVLVNGTGFFGVGSVPESYSRKVFRDLQVKPFGDPSFFIFHQDLVPYIPNASLKISDLPRGFSYYINGHIHAPKLHKNLLVVGSTVVTQMKPDETEKFVWIWDNGFERHQIDARPLHYFEVDAAERSPSEVLTEIDEALQKIIKGEYGEEPMVRIRVLGKLAAGFKPGDLIFHNDYNLIVHFNKRLEGSALASADMEELDVDELTIKTLEDVLKGRGLKLDASRLYTYLLRGDETEVWKLLGEST